MDRETEADRQTDRQTETETETDRQTSSESVAKPARSFKPYYYTVGE